MKWALLRSIAGRWLLPGALLLAVVGYGVTWLHGYSKGRADQRVEMQSELEVARTAQAQVADELEQARADRTPQIREVIRYVDRVVDGCADVPVPDGVLSALGGRDG
jgi:hypothetical protein